MKKILIITLALSLFPVFDSPAMQEDAHKYIFLQQVNPMCMIAPILNLQLVEKFAQNGYKVSALPAFSRREWFAKEIKPLLNWHRAFQKLNLSPRNYPYLCTFIDDVIKHGPIFPHFYDKYGNFAFQGIQGAMDCQLAPLALIDYNDLANKKITACGFTIESLDHVGPPLGLQIPLGCDSAQNYKVYQENEMGAVTCSTLEPGYCPEDLLSKAFGLTASEYRSNTLVQWKTLGIRPTFLGAIGTGLFRNERFYIPYLVGMYSLMLMTIGVDTHNNPVTNDSQDYQAYQDLKKLMESTDNPWNNQYFNRNNFLQYQIAEVLKNDRELFNEAQQTVDFYLRPWTVYNNLKNGHYYKRVIDQSNGTITYTQYSTEQISRFIPGEEQAMAYYLSSLARMLWYGACSTKGKVFYNNAHSSWIPFIWSFEGFKANARKQKQISALDGTPYRASYLETWNKLIIKLKQRWQEKCIDRLNWVSFDDHGWVCSFDQNIIDLQNSVPGVDIDLLNQLKFACIDSWQGSDLNVFYKTSGHKILPKSRQYNKVYNLVRYDE